MRSVVSNGPATMDVGRTTDSASWAEAERYRPSPPVGATIGTNQSSVSAPRIAPPTTTVRTRRTPSTQAMSHIGRSRSMSDLRSGRVSEPRVHDAAQPHVEDVARWVGLVFDDVVLAQRERELHGVPVVEHARPVGQPGQHGEDGERAGKQVVPAVGAVAHRG